MIVTDEEKRMMKPPQNVARGNTQLHADYERNEITDETVRLKCPNVHDNGVINVMRVKNK